MDPQEELFIAIRQMLVDLFGADSVYDTVLPPEGTPYPFAYVADTQLVDSPNKGAVFGKVFQTVHFWHNNPKKRGTLSGMMLKAKQAAHSLNRTDSFTWIYISATQNIMADTTTAQPLLHGVIEFEFKFS